nr:PilW family protein [Pseudomonadota bacterium]
LELNRIEVRVAGAFAADGAWPGCRIPTINNREQVAEGVENFQILYGVFNPADRTTRYLTADQVNFDSRAPQTLVAVRVALLLSGVNTVARGLNAPTTFNLLGTEVNTANDGRLRRVFTTTITLRNRL